jgi:hypothetical protein
MTTVAFFFGPMCFTEFLVSFLSSTCAERRCDTMAMELFLFGQTYLLPGAPFLDVFQIASPRYDLREAIYYFCSLSLLVPKNAQRNS